MAKLFWVVLGSLWLCLIWVYLVPPGIKDKARSVAPGIAPRARVVLEEQETVHEDHFSVYLFETKGGGVTVDVTVEDGPRMDVYCVPEGEVGRFKSTHQMNYLPELSAENTRSVSKSAVIPAGRYAIVLDNTDFGGSMPPMNMIDDFAVVRVRVGVDE